MNKADKPMVIVGSGGAAIHAVKAIRKNGYQGELHLFSDSIEPPFNPMLITYYLSGKIPIEKCYLFENSFQFFRDYKVKLHSNSPVVELNVQEKSVVNADGEKVEYQSCLIASGASAILPPISGNKNQRVFTIRKIEDAVKLRDLCLENPKRVLIVGASMVGMKLVEIFQEAGSEVYLADLASHVFAQTAHPLCACLMEEQLLRRGIKLLLNLQVEWIEESKESLKVSFGGLNIDLEVDLLVFCIGVKPNLEFIQPRDLAIQRGILVDNRMHASAENIYAAGDVAQALNVMNNKKEVISLWSNACQQGQIAGANMAGANLIYPGSIPQNITHFFNMFFVSIGDIQHYDEVEKKHTNQSCTFVFKSKDQIVGTNLLTFDDYELMNDIGIFRYQLLKSLQSA